MNRGKLALIALVAALLLAPCAAACFSPADLYAVEVVLNKPGVSYDLSKLASMPGVVPISYMGQAYAYKSHCDSRLLVVVSVQPLKPRPPSLPVPGPPSKLCLMLRKPVSEIIETVDSRLGKAKSLGWSVSRRETTTAVVYEFEKRVDDCWVKVTLTVRAVGNSSEVCVSTLAPSCASASKLTGEARALVSALGLGVFAGSVVVKPQSIGEGGELYAAVRIQVPIVIEKYELTVYVASVSAGPPPPSADKIQKAAEELRDEGWATNVRAGGRSTCFMFTKNASGVTLVASGCAGEWGLRVSLMARKRGDFQLTDGIVAEFNHVLKALGVSSGLSISSFNKHQYTESSGVKPAFNITREEAAEALATELKWLSKVGVISGLSEDDIKAIASVAKLGYAGWNSRIIWDSGRWVPYHSVYWALLVKCISEAPEFFIQGSQQIAEAGVPQGWTPQGQPPSPPSSGFRAMTTPASGGRQEVYTIVGARPLTLRYLVTAALVALVVAVTCHFALKRKMRVIE